MLAAVLSKARLTIALKVRRAWGRTQIGGREVTLYGPWANVPSISGGNPGVVFTQYGEDWVIDVLDAAFVPGTQYIHWGTGAGVPAKGSTDVSAPALEGRATATRTQVLSDKMRWTGTMTCTGVGKTITNAGLFKDTSGSNAIIVGDHAAQILNVSDQIAYTITLEMT